MKEESWGANHVVPRDFKRPKVERFKGVVPQQNGHWGAQIYANHQRIWLGTFRSETEAATAYDSASIILRNGDSHRNFPLTNHTILEPKFQSHFSTESILNMIRDGSYPFKFADFLRSQQPDVQIGLKLVSPPIGSDTNGEFSCTLLFQKELTPSDVGKLNRLVIPKRYAVKHFPSVPDQVLDDERVEEVQLEFHDREMNLWKFRYCYWKSSQSFVFTRGWNRFVKDKGLAANDTISFYMYESRHFGKSFLVIDHVGKKEDDDGNMNEINLVDKIEGVGDQSNDAKGFKLFGVQIAD